MKKNDKESSTGDEEEAVDIISLLSLPISFLIKQLEKILKCIKKYCEKKGWGKSHFGFLIVGFTSGLLLLYLLFYFGVLTPSLWKNIPQTESFKLTEDNPKRFKDFTIKLEEASASTNTARITILTEKQIGHTFEQLGESETVDIHGTKYTIFFMGITGDTAEFDVKESE